MSKGTFGFTKFGFSRIGQIAAQSTVGRTSAFKAGGSTTAKPADVSFAPRVLSATKSYVVLSTTGGSKADMIINLNRKTVSTKESTSPFSKIASFAKAGNGITIGNTTFTLQNGVLKVFFNGSTNPQLTFNFGDRTLAIDANGDGTIDRTLTLCFMAGTMIATPDGERSIESLKTGDLVLTAEGKAMPIRWVGKQEVSKTFADPITAMPVLVKAGALGDGLPKRNLFLSPAHALCLDGSLVQAGAIVNGQSIVRFRDTAETFTYYNIELAEHALILAEGVEAETFLDSASRENYDNWAEREELAELAPMAAMNLPRVLSARQVPASVRSRLEGIAKAEQVGDRLASAA